VKNEATMSDALYRGNISIGATDDTGQAFQSLVSNAKQALR
jgi:hypothetical protein